MLVLFHVFSNILANLKELSFTFITTNVVIFQLFWLTIDSLKFPSYVLLKYCLYSELQNILKFDFMKRTLLTK